MNVITEFVTIDVIFDSNNNDLYDSTWLFEKTSVEISQI